MKKLSEQQQLAIAIQIATKAHAGQFDKGGMPYILHPLHLMNQLLADLPLATIAVLHDVIEDSKYTIADLRKKGISERVLKAVKLLTHKKGQDYLNSYIKEIATNYDALRVKQKDLEHNSAITRLKGVTTKDLQRMERYHKAFIYLGEAKALFDKT